MKKLLVVSLALLLMCAIASPAFARDVREEVVQKSKGGIKTTDTALSQHGEAVTGISIMASSSNCTVGLYDCSDTADATNANNVWEGGCLANTSLYVDFTDAEIRTSSGLTVIMNNAAGVNTYTLQ